jgi:DNA-binding NarL/FixJ family response regulator
MSDEIIKLYESGKKPAEIAEELNLDKKYVARVIITYIELKRLNIK